MNLAKYLKGTTSIGELMNMPNRYIQVIYKQYVTMLNDKEKSEANQAEQMGDEIEEAMMGG